MSKVSFQTFYLFCSSLYAFNSMSIRFFHEWLTRRQLSIDIGSTWLRIWTPMWLSPGFDINWSIIEEQLHPVHSVWKSQKKSHSTFASEASYVYILRGQKLIKNAKNGPFWRVFENLKLAVKQCYQTGQF